MVTICEILKVRENDQFGRRLHLCEIFLIQLKFLGLSMTNLSAATRLNETRRFNRTLISMSTITTKLIQSFIIFFDLQCRRCASPICSHNFAVINLLSKFYTTSQPETGLNYTLHINPFTPDSSKSKIDKCFKITN